MRLCWSSASYWPQTKVTLFVKSISLVLVLGLFLGLDTVAVHSSPVQVHRNTQQLHYCDYTSTGKIYDIADLLKCMNELASIKNNRRRGRSTEESIPFFPNPSQVKQYSQNSPYQQSSDYASNNLHRGPSYPGNNPGYYKYPPALLPGYPLTSDSSSTPGILGINLVDALSSISNYDDLKCVPRIICEVAAGVIPGNSVYKQNNANTGMNALISFLTAVNSGDTSPLLNFGKSALMGYANRGNSEICYRQYSKCPRNPNEVVNYLNNHNGGFFRFFNRNSGLGYRAKVDNEALSSLQNTVSDRKGTGELKFDTATPIKRSGTLNFDDKKDDGGTVIFPNEQRHFNRLIKSFDYEFENRGVAQEKPTFFPQDRMDQKLADQLYYLSQSESTNQQQNLYNKSKMSEAKLYLFDNISNENYKRFVFPDGQSVMINIGFSKLFDDSYKKMLKRGLIMNDIPQPINFEGLSVINLPELYTQDDTQQYTQVIHPCDMICHDSRGIAVQFYQVVDPRGRLSTIMTPEQPIVDLSQPLPCEIICLSRNGDRHQLSTTLSKVLRVNDHGKHEVNRWTNRFKRAPSDNKTIKRRFVGDTFIRKGTKPLSYDILPPQTSDVDLPINLPFAIPIESAASWSAEPPEYPWKGFFPNGENSRSIPISPNDDGHLLDSVVLGENPLAYAITVQPQPTDPSSIGSDISPIPATMIMCRGFVFFIPVNAQSSPICGTPMDENDVPGQGRILYQPQNRWGNYTNFLAHFTNITDNQDVSRDTDRPLNIDRTTGEMFQFTPMPPIIYQTEEPVEVTIPPSLSSLPQKSEEFDYQQPSSCLEGESWDKFDQHCVPIKYHEDAEYEYPNVPGYNWEKIPVKKRDDERQKIVIRTPDADMYIESV